MFYVSSPKDFLDASSHRPFWPVTTCVIWYFLWSYRFKMCRNLTYFDMNKILSSFDRCAQLVMKWFKLLYRRVHLEIWPVRTHVHVHTLSYWNPSLLFSLLTSCEQIVMVVSDEEIRQTIKRTWDTHSYLVCPHTATGVTYHYQQFERYLKRLFTPLIYLNRYYLHDLKDIPILSHYLT